MAQLTAVLLALVLLACRGLDWGASVLTSPRHPPTPVASTRRELYTAGGCPNVGDACSVTFINRIPQLSVSGACAGTGVGAVYAPATCNFTNATVVDVNDNAQVGTCMLSPAGFPASVRPGRTENHVVIASCITFTVQNFKLSSLLNLQVYNSTCSSSTDPLACSTPDGAFACKGGPPGRCVYDMYAASSGDPCLDVQDCNDSSFCNSTLGVCMPLPDATYCYMQGQCGPGSFCNMSDVSGAYACAPFLAVGADCANTNVRNNVYGPNGGCAPNAFCYTNSSVSTTGVCTPLNVLPAGALFSAPPLLWYSYAMAGAQLCAGGLSVAVPDSSGNAGELGRCAASLNLTAMGQPCTSCVLSASNGYPVYGDGSLVCAPVGPLSSCMLYPTSPYTAEYWRLTAASANCTASSRGPTGVPCAPGSTVAGRCAYLLCSNILAQLAVLVNSGSARWPLWAPYFPNPSTPACIASIADANATWKSALPPAAFCNVTLPRAFAARGWTCGGPAPSSLSPSASMTPSTSLSPSMTQSPSPTPSTTRTTSLTPSMSRSSASTRTQTRSMTASMSASLTLTPSQSGSITLSPSLSVVSRSPPVSASPVPVSPSATASPTQTVSTGLTPTATPMPTGTSTPTPTPSQTVTTGLTPTASPITAANTPGAAATSSPDPSVGLAVGVAVGVVVVVGLAAVVVYWALRRAHTPHTPFTEGSGPGSPAHVQTNPALGGGGGQDGVQFVQVTRA